MPAGFGDAYHGSVDGGWGGISAPTAFGGQGLPFSLPTAALECFGSANFALTLIHGLTIIAIDAIASHGSVDQQARWLPRLITGEWSGTMNLTEPQAGSDVGALSTTAEPVGDNQYLIKGTKIFISFGEHDLADNIVHLVLARIKGAPGGTRGISLFLVPKYRLDARGLPDAFNDVRCLSIENKLGLHASPTCVMSFGEEGGCIGELVGAENAGMQAMFTMMNSARLNVGNQGVQIAEAATQKAVAFARERIQSVRADGSSGKHPVPIREHPDVARMLLRMRALTEAARAIIYYTAGWVDRQAAEVEGAAARLGLLTPLAKAWCTDIGSEVASLAIQVHGGMGYVEETGIAQFYRDVRITSIYEGTNGIQAADLVSRKLWADGGAAMRGLLNEIAADLHDKKEMLKLHEAVSDGAAWLLTADINDRLAGSYAFLTMTATLVAGWLLLRHARAVDAEGSAFRAAKVQVVEFFLSQIVPAAAGIAPQVKVGAALLHAN
jgi:alkylation response protein AidB-like acyl-CoA dehydrogenase